jgi:hypothetical protein
MKKQSRKTQYKDLRMKYWRSQVLMRDNNTCLSCEEKDCLRKPVKPRHILSLKDFPDLSYEVDNGICLCPKCYFWLRGGDYKEVCIRLVVEQKIKIQKEKENLNE